MSLTDSQVPPQIASALDELRARVRRRFFIHGIGWLVAAGLGLLLLHFLLDRGLELPRLPRLVVLAAILIFIARGVRRRLLYPMQRELSRRDLALLIERNHPELHHQLISAVQLDAAKARGDSAPMIERVQQNAAERVRAIDTSGVLRNERTLRVWSFAGASVLAIGLAFALAPASFRIWGQRLFGFDLEYPRDTFLTIEIPADQGNYRIVSAEESGEIHVQVARGAELPVNVFVDGVVPPFVELVTRSNSGGEQRIPMSRRGEARFRTVLRRTLQSMTLFARGGDDDGTRSVRVEILVPPAATDIETTVEAPAYTGRATNVSEGGLVEALPGSTVTIRFRATTPLSSARLDFQESEMQVVAAVETQADTGTSDVESKLHVARFTMPEKTDRYRLSLVAENGLAELAPSFYSVIPIPDEKPRIRLFSPSGSLQAMTVGSRLPLRWFASDDFGLRRVQLRASIGGEEDKHERDLFAFEADAKGDAAKKAPAEPSARGEERETTATPDDGKKRGAFELLDVAKLAGATSTRKPQVGDRIQLELVALDNRTPEAQEGRPQPFRIDLLDPDELSRRLQSKLRSTRATVERAARVQDEQSARLKTFIAALDSATRERRKLSISAAEAGQQRIRGFLLQIRSEFQASLEAHLFNGLDDSPEVATVLARYATFYEARVQHPSGDPSFWVELAKARKDGKVGRLDVLGRLNDMLLIAHQLLSERNDRALRALASASTANEDASFLASMKSVQQEQGAIADGLQRLLALLEDWNDYQDLVRIARRLRDAQRDLNQRIKSKR